MLKLTNLTLMPYSARVSTEGMKEKTESGFQLWRDHESENRESLFGTCFVISFGSICRANDSKAKKWSSRDQMGKSIKSFG